MYKGDEVYMRDRGGYHNNDWDHELNSDEGDEDNGDGDDRHKFTKVKSLKNSRTLKNMRILLNILQYHRDTVNRHVSLLK